MKTPIMKQFEHLKAKHPDAVLLFRCGDFYEAYDEDADVVSVMQEGRPTGRLESSRAMGTTLTVRFPHHQLDVILPKLVRTGHRVAICDQLEDPKNVQKLVKRGTTELVPQQQGQRKPQPVQLSLDF